MNFQPYVLALIMIAILPFASYFITLLFTRDVVVPRGFSGLTFVLLERITIISTVVISAIVAAVFFIIIPVHECDADQLVLCIKTNSILFLINIPIATLWAFVWYAPYHILRKYLIDRSRFAPYYGVTQADYATFFLECPFSALRYYISHEPCRARRIARRVLLCRTISNTLLGTLLGIHLTCATISFCQKSELYLLFWNCWPWGKS